MSPDIHEAGLCPAGPERGSGGKCPHLKEGPRVQARRFDYQKDVGPILELMPELYESNFHDFVADSEFIGRKRYQLREASRDPAQTILVCEDELGVTGFIWLILSEDYGGERRGEVAAVCVASRARGGGIGRALMLQGEATLRMQGASQMHLMVTATNAQAVGLYHSLGFGVTRYQMEKSLRRGS